MFLEKLTILDAERLQQSAKATIQKNGRLSFTAEAGRVLNLKDDKSIIIFSADDGDLGAIVSHKGDKRAFELKKVGSYYYIPFKNYLQEAGIDYKNQRVIYDITALSEEWDNKRLYRFARRILPYDAANDDIDDTLDDTTVEGESETQENALQEPSLNETDKNADLLQEAGTEPSVPLSAQNESIKASSTADTQADSDTYNANTSENSSDNTNDKETTTSQMGN